MFIHSAMYVYNRTITSTLFRHTHAPATNNTHTHIQPSHTHTHACVESANISIYFISAVLSIIDGSISLFLSHSFSRIVSCLARSSVMYLLC